MRKLLALLALLASPVRADMIPWGGGGGGASATAVPVATPTPELTGCTNSSGVLTCADFTTTDTGTNANNYKLPHWRIFDYSADTMMATTDLTTDDPNGFQFAISDSVTHSIDFNMYTITGPKLLTVRQNDASGPNIGMTSIPSSGVLYSDGDVILDSEGGAIRFATNGIAFSNEVWRMTAAGLLQSIGTGTAIELLEVVAPTGAANNDFLYADSTAHRFKVKANNGSAQTLAYLSEIPNTPTPAPTVTPVPTATPQSGTTVKTDYSFFTTNSFNSGATNYSAVVGVNALTATQDALLPWVLAGTWKNLACWTGATAQSASKAEAIALDKNGSGATALVCTINAASTCTTLLGSAFSATGKCCEDTTHTVSTAIGDGVIMRFTPSNTPNTGVVACEMEFDPS